MIDLRQLNSNERVDFLIKIFYKSEYNFDIFKMIIEDIIRMQLPKLKQIILIIKN